MQPQPQERVKQKLKQAGTTQEPARIELAMRRQAAEPRLTEQGLMEPGLAAPDSAVPDPMRMKRELRLQMAQARTEPYQAVAKGFPPALAAVALV